jgi:GNAT superfamily N-acetyltransferase
MRPGRAGHDAYGCRSLRALARADPRHAATFVALDGGRVVGYATLEHLYGQRHRLEHGLTAVLRAHRGRGVATMLKSAQIAWAAHHGYTE